MSTRYGTYDASHPDNYCQIVDTSTYTVIDSTEVAERMNKMEDVIIAAENICEQWQDPNSPYATKLMDTLKALKPKPKTTEQLLAERLEAADNLATTSAYCGDAVRHDAAITYEAAKAAHEASL